MIKLGAKTMPHSSAPMALPDRLAAAGVAMRRMVAARRPGAQANAEAAQAGTKPVKAVAKKHPAKRK
jgi:hypothetical protein